MYRSILLVFSFFLVGCSFGTPLTGDKVWVDSVYGNDLTAVLFDLSLPYKTLGAAVSAAESHVISTGSGVVLHLYPGSYNSVSIPHGISIEGEGARVTRLRGGLSLEGVSTIDDVSISSSNEPAISANSSSVAAEFFGCLIDSRWTIDPLGRPALLDLSRGSFRFEGGSSVSTVSSSSSVISFVRHRGPSEDFVDHSIDVQVTGNAPGAVLFDIEGPVGAGSDDTNLKFDFGQCKINHRGTGGFVYLLRTKRANTRLVGSIVNIQGKKTSKATIVHATGDNTVKIGASTGNTKVDAGSIYSAEGYSVLNPATDSWESSDVRFVGDAWVNEDFPVYIGNFSRIDVSLDEGRGLTTDGSLGTGIKRAEGTAFYKWTSSDSNLLVASPMEVHLPDPRSLSPGRRTDGREARIKNVSSGIVWVKGSLHGYMSSHVLSPDRAHVWVSYEDKWYLISST